MGHSLLDLAAAQGYCDVIRSLLARGADVNKATPSGRTALHCAAFRDQAAAVDTLIANGARIEAADDQGCTPLHVASANGASEAIISLLHHGAVANKLNSDGRPPLLLAVENGRLAAATLLLHASEEEDEGSVNHRYGVDEYSALDLAVRGDHTKIFQMILRHRAEVNAQDSDGVTALDLAALNDHPVMIDNLVEAGAVVGAQAHGRHNRTALHIACAEGSNTAAKALLVRGASIFKRDSLHRTPLHLAARNGDVATVETLLAWGSDPAFHSSSNIYHHSALDEAAYWGHVGALRAMCSSVPFASGRTGVNREIFDRIRKRDVLYSISTALSVAAARNQVGAIDALVGAGGANVNAGRGSRGLGGTPIHYAAETGAFDAIAALARHGANLNDLGGELGCNEFDGKPRTALHTVAFLGWTRAAKALLAAGANPSVRCYYHGDQHTPLDIASEKGHVEMMREMIKCGVDVNGADPDKGTTALHVAAAFDQVAAIRVLAKAGCNLNALDNNGCTPLHAYSLNAYWRAVATLAVAGADVNRVNNEGKPPLHLALNALRPHLDAVKALLAAGAETTARNNEDTSALDLAAKAGHVAVIRVLIEAGAPVDAEDGDGRTALMHAVKANNADAVDVLLSAGADVEAHLTDESWTSLHAAAEDTHFEVVRVLLRHGADVHARDAENDNDTPLHVAVRQAGMEGALEIVEALLGRDADESAHNDNYLTPVSVVGSMGGVDAAVAVTTLLLRAPGDRAWRRRGLLILCCARAKKTGSAAATRSSPEEGQGPRQRRSIQGGAGAARLNASGTGEGGKESETQDLAATTAAVNDNFDKVTAWLLELQEEGLFRIVVGFL